MDLFWWDSEREEKPLPNQSPEPDVVVCLHERYYKNPYVRQGVSCSGDPRGLFPPYGSRVVPCFPVFPVVQLGCERCCCLIDCSSVSCDAPLPTERPAPSGRVSSRHRQLWLWLPALTQLSQVMNSVGNPWAGHIQTHIRAPGKTISEHCKSSFLGIRSVFLTLFFLFQTFYLWF